MRPFSDAYGLPLSHVLEACGVRSQWCKVRPASLRGDAPRAARWGEREVRTRAVLAIVTRWRALRVRPIFGFYDLPASATALSCVTLECDSALEFSKAPMNEGFAKHRGKAGTPNNDNENSRLESQLHAAHHWTRTCNPPPGSCTTERGQRGLVAFANRAACTAASITLALPTCTATATSLQKSRTQVADRSYGP